MFGLVDKKYIRKLLNEMYDKGLKTGLELGIRVGQIRAGDKGIIVSDRVQQEIEKILEETGREG